MKLILRRTALIAAIALLAVAVSGCTLSGATAAPLTPVGTGIPTSTPTTAALLPSPTPTVTIDVFGTQTIQALTPASVGLTPGTTGTPGTPGTPGIGVTPQTPGTLVVTPTIGTPGTTTVRTPTPAAAAGTCPSTHTVAAGENLFRIAMRYGITTDELAAANGITNPDRIAVGQVLRIPRCGTGTGGSTTTTGGTPAATGPLQPLAGDTVDTNGDILHAVREGENLYRIALAYNMSWQVVAAYNGITNPDALVVGQVIRIPTR